MIFTKFGSITIPGRWILGNPISHCIRLFNSLFFWEGGGLLCIWPLIEENVDERVKSST